MWMKSDIFGQYVVTHLFHEAQSLSLDTQNVDIILRTWISKSEFWL